MQVKGLYLHLSVMLDKSSTCNAQPFHKYRDNTKYIDDNRSYKPHPLLWVQKYAAQPSDIRSNRYDNRIFSAFDL